MGLKIRITNRLTAPLALALALLIAGCQGVQVADPLTQQLAGNDDDAQLEFWHTLTERSLTSNDEAFHGVLLFIDGQDDAADYAGRVGLLRSRQMLPVGFDRPGNEAVQRGTLAVAICRYLDIGGGVMLHLFRQSPRYCTRELQYMNLLPPSSPHQTLSGTEFVGVIGRVEDYERVAHPVDAASIRPDADEAEPQADEAPGENDDAAPEPENE